MSLGSLGLTDPAVPGAALIGDGARLREIASDAGDRLIDRGYLRYKPGTSLVAALTLSSGPGFAYAVGAAAAPKLRKTLDRAPHGSVLWHSAADGLLLARADADRDLPGPTRADRLAGILPALAGVTRWTTLAYKPQRRWVARPLDGCCPLPFVVRAYRRSDLPGAMAGWQLAAEAAAHGSGIVVPQILARDERRGSAVASWLPGTSLDRLLADDSASSELLASVGGQLARLHDGLPERPGDGVSRGLRAAAVVLRELAAVLPDCHARAAEALRRMTAEAPTSRLLRPTHGDFSADQVVVDPHGAVGFTDWDRGGWGNPAVDLGSLRAAGLSPVAHAAVLAGYAAVREPPAGIDWYTQLTRMLRLTEPLRQCRPDWRTEIAARLSVVEEAMG